MNIKKRLNKTRILRKKRTHIKVRVLSNRPRLSVHRSNAYISVQLIDDEKHETIASVSSRELKEKGTKTEVAKKVGLLVAEKAKKAGIKEVVFDRGGRAYHGRVKAVAEGAREGGLEF
ncbi:50S ribosomal protein L18 [Candidatus Jorgensenbacteria bacterium RIFCSPLOWO2_01_FULL_45_25b]|uniref:Large ribosomal subunit protein uL18 n=1 Tax=Candidatus Jorgensenbacteria bacterium RIFCSPLOWO2_01_FULL_45_25b TaxID=1798471 RepID=A0A1F6BV03_9BACT|nr:MAG: 50S ribosomal protein L18 [Candidatus Jorgensenbacteria bacterium RIFCSPLOWO2_01_FULL_45_25b]